MELRNASKLFRIKFAHIQKLSLPQLVCDFDDRGHVVLGMENLRIGAPSLLEGSVVWYSDVIQLPHVVDRACVIFSFQVVRYRS
jgi:hypothetical protein